MPTNKPFYLTGSQGEGTRLFVAPVPCSLTEPETQIITVAVGGAAAGATSIPVEATTNTRIVDTNPYLKFVDPTTGEEFLVEVDGDIAPGATTITVKTLPKDIPDAATADYPTKLGGRATINNSTEDDEAELENFDNQGWRDYVKTSLGQMLSTTGHFLVLDAGYMNCLKARLSYQIGEPGKVFARLLYPKPACDDTYTSGLEFSGICNVASMPIESGAKAVISGNIDLKFCGIVTVRFNGQEIVVRP